MSPNDDPKTPESISNPELNADDLDRVVGGARVEAEPEPEPEPTPTYDPAYIPGDWD